MTWFRNFDGCLLSSHMIALQTLCNQHHASICIVVLIMPGAKDHMLSCSSDLLLKPTHKNLNLNAKLMPDKGIQESWTICGNIMSLS